MADQNTFPNSELENENKKIEKMLASCLANFQHNIEIFYVRTINLHCPTSRTNHKLLKMAFNAKFIIFTSRRPEDFVCIYGVPLVSRRFLAQLKGVED